MYTLHVNAAGGEQDYTMHVHRRLMVVLNLLCDVYKSSVNVGMPRKRESGIGILAGSQLLQSGIGIPVTEPVRYRWLRLSPALSSRV